MTVEAYDGDPARYGPQHYAAATWVAAMRPAVDLARVVSDTDFVPDALRGNPPAVAAAIMTGYELGIGPMAALRAIHIINGRPSLSAELMRGLALAAGHHVIVTEATPHGCTVKARRRDDPGWQTFTYTLEDAKRANLANRGPWRSDPRAMLIARATSLACRTLMSDLTMGIAVAEELADGDSPVIEEPPAPVPESRKVRRKPLEAVPAPPTPSAPSESLSARPVTPAELDPEPAPDPGAQAHPGDGKTTGTEPLPAPAVDPPSRAQIVRLHALMNAAGYRDRADKLQVASLRTGRQIGSSTELTRQEVVEITDWLMIQTGEAPPPDDQPPEPA